MAYVAMPCIVMAYIAMACIVMVCIVMAHIVMAVRDARRRTELSASRAEKKKETKDTEGKKKAHAPVPCQLA